MCIFYLSIVPRLTTIWPVLTVSPRTETKLWHNYIASKCAYFIYRSQVDHDMASVDGESQDGNKVPKIHIIDSRDDPPLAQALPLPPVEHDRYSMRRSLILDAPSVPKPPRSPSPERRYVRTVPRDMVEAAKRRCLRARVRTK